MSYSFRRLSLLPPQVHCIAALSPNVLVLAYLAASRRSHSASAVCIPSISTRPLGRGHRGSAASILARGNFRVLRATITPFWRWASITPFWRGGLVACSRLVAPSWVPCLRQLHASRLAFCRLGFHHALLARWARGVLHCRSHTPPVWHSAVWASITPFWRWVCCERCCSRQLPRLAGIPSVSSRPLGCGHGVPIRDFFAHCLVLTVAANPR